jgi:homopolymeric O-antigen transport system ATP-binding protein
VSEPVITVENVTKLYRIGKRAQVDTLRETLISSFSFPIKNLRQLVRLTKFDDLGQSTNEDNDIIYALKDVSFEVRQGERLGIIGRNGAGKSTMLKILSRIIGPTKGRIRIRGRVGSLLEVGTGFHPELTGRENVYMNGAVLGMKHKEIKAKFDEIVEFSGVEKFLDTPVKRYSSGMFVRLAFALAAHLEPDILMIDEVLSVGDAEFQKKCFEKLSGVTKEGRTVVFVAHDLGTIERLCPRVILLEDGRVRMDGDSKTCVEEYMKEFT